MKKECGNCYWWIFYFKTIRTFKYRNEIVDLGKCRRTGDWRARHGLPCEHYTTSKPAESKINREVAMKTLRLLGYDEEKAKEIIAKMEVNK